MLNRFNSNTRQLNRIVKKYNLTNISASVYESIEVSGSNDFKTIMGDYINQSYTISSSFDGRDLNGNPLPIEQAKLELSASIAYTYTASLDVRIPTKFSGRTKSNPNPIKLVNNKTKISNFYQEILQNSARMIQRKIDLFDNTEFGSLTILNVYLDYGTEGANPDNFDVLVYGLQIPGDYSVKEVGNNVVVTLNNSYIDFDSVTADDIYVIGKLVELNLDTEDYFDIRTENDENIIL
jgi:uncharacterized membrane protein YvbJ